MRGCVSLSVIAQIIPCSGNVVCIFDDNCPCLLHAAELFPQRNPLAASVNSDIKFYSSPVVVCHSHFLDSLNVFINLPDQDHSEIAAEQQSNCGL